MLKYTVFRLKTLYCPPAWENRILILNRESLTIETLYRLLHIYLFARCSKYLSMASLQVLKQMIYNLNIIVHCTIVHNYHTAEIVKYRGNFPSDGDLRFEGVGIFFTAKYDFYWY